MGKTTFFGKITSLIFDYGNYRFEVDAVEISDNTLSSGLGNLSLLETYMLSFTLDNDEYDEYFTNKVNNVLELKGRWIRIDVNLGPGGFAGISIISTSSPNFEEDFDYSLTGKSITVLNPENNIHSDLISKLLILVNLDGYYDSSKTNETLDLLDNTLMSVNTDLVSVVNFNVGHGNAVGVFNENYDPLFYIDIGGGSYLNRKTYNNVLDFPVNDKTFIILTHWDSDHFETAFRNPEKFESCKWIAPLQESSFLIKKFASLINNNLVLIKDELNSVRFFQFVRIFRCSGKKRNDSGLAIKLELRKNDDISDILFPGDAQYEFIDESLKLVDAINVTHHGGKLNSYKGFPIPKSKGEGLVVYSYGKFNSYSHPCIETINTHVQNGWGADRFGKKYSLSTSNMSVMYTKNRNLADEFYSRHTNLGQINCFFGIQYNSMSNKETTYSKELWEIDND